MNTIPGISDHETVVIDTALKLNVNRKLPRNIKHWTKADWGSMKKEALDYQAEYFNKPDDRSVEARYKDFHDLVTHLIDKFVPSKMSSTRHNLPWCTPSIRSMTRKKKKTAYLMEEVSQPEGLGSIQVLPEFNHQGAEGSQMDIHRRHADLGPRGRQQLILLEICQVTVR